MGTREEFDRIFYSYAANINGLEEENKFLRETVENLKTEVEKFRKKPLLVCNVKYFHDDSAVIKLPNGNEFLVEMAQNCDDIKEGDVVLAEQKNLTIVKKVPTPKKYEVEKFVIVEKPTTKWEEIGGLAKEQELIKEIIELPLKKPKLFEKIGITPPKGILLHGPPGTGKTLLAKAVAASTNSTFIELVGSELVQKFIGEGAKLVKDIFDLARQKAPAIVFIDEIDAIAATRVEVGTSGEREVQRTFMQLLAEIDGFKSLDNIKIIGCTNRRDILDSAITRPGRLDRLIFVDVPDEEGRKEIFKIHSKRMTLDKKVDFDAIVAQMKEFTGAEIKATCTEAGYCAIRANRTKIMHKDFHKAVLRILEEKELDDGSHTMMFG